MVLNYKVIVIHLKYVAGVGGGERSREVQLTKSRRLFNRGTLLDRVGIR